MLKVIKPRREYLESYAEAMAEGFINMALGGFGNFTPEEIRNNPDQVLTILNQKEPRIVKTKDNREFLLHDHEIWWIVDETRFIGAISLRYDDDPIMLSYAGHVGMAIRPSLLNKGFGVKGINIGYNKAKEEFKKRGLKRIMASCETENTASARLIKHNGGILTGTIENGGGYGKLEVYWIDVI